jgi:hypothetical protein
LIKDKNSGKEIIIMHEIIGKIVLLNGQLARDLAMYYCDLRCYFFRFRSLAEGVLILNPLIFRSVSFKGQSPPFRVGYYTSWQGLEPLPTHLFLGNPGLKAGVPSRRD